MRRKIYALLFTVSLLCGLAACSPQKPANGQTADTVRVVETEEIQGPASTDDVSAETDTFSQEEYGGRQGVTQEEDSGQQSAPQEETGGRQSALREEEDGVGSIPREEENMDQNQFYITAGETVFTADFCDNSSAEAFRELLADGPLTIDMHDYGNFEKVGEIGSTLPANDEQITTEPGDVILYLGTSITIYYDTNSWNFTRLGKIHDVTKEELLAAFGGGDVTVTFSVD